MPQNLLFQQPDASAQEVRDKTKSEQTGVKAKYRWKGGSWHQYFLRQKRAYQNGFEFLYATILGAERDAALLWAVVTEFISGLMKS